MFRNEEQKVDQEPRDPFARLNILPVRMGSEEEDLFLVSLLFTPSPAERKH